MARTPDLDPVFGTMTLEHVRRFALSLPSTTEEPHFAYTSFRVAGKIFATVPPDDAHLHVFVDEEQRRSAIALDPASVAGLTWGARVVGLRVTLAKARPALVEALLVQSWARKASKRLLASADVDRDRAGS